MAGRVRVREVRDDEGNRLKRIVRRGSGSVVTWRRAQMVLWSAQGMSVAQIAGLAFTSEDRVRDVLHNFNADGFESLYPRYAGGHPPVFTLAQRREIKKIAKSKPGEHGLAFSRWSLAKLADFLVAEGVVVFAGRRAWVTGGGPKAIFADPVGWLRDRNVLLPGVSRLARLVARERDAATQRLWETLYAALTGPQRLALDALLEVPPGARVSVLPGHHEERLQIEGHRPQRVRPAPARHELQVPGPPAAHPAGNGPGQNPTRNAQDTGSCPFQHHPRL
jgi:transposase